jgi:hypothetical protein
VNGMHSAGCRMVIKAEGVVELAAVDDQIRSRVALERPMQRPIGVSLGARSARWRLIVGRLRQPMNG